MNSNAKIHENDYLKAFEIRLQSLEQRVKEVESHLHPVVSDQIALFLTVPDSLRKSLFAVNDLCSATADDVCIKTGRHRSIENKYLNELVRAGWLNRERIGKKVYYSMQKKKDNEVIESIDELDKKLEKILD